MKLSRREVGALGALGFILVVTAGWWAAALWPLPTTTPEWVLRARAACFGSTESGLPNSGGWIMLIGTPLTMIAALMIIWGGAVRDGVSALLRSGVGRAVAAAIMVALLAGGTAAYGRVAAAYAAGAPMPDFVAAEAVPLPAAPLGAEPPALGLVDQHGEIVTLDRFHGRAVLVTFAFGHCETICPLIVRNTLDAVDALGDAAPVVIVVTVDPWRDTPSRLPHIARGWGLPSDAHLLGGAVDDVEAVLDAWQVTRSRDPRTGEVAHPSLVYVLDSEGRIAYVVTGERERIVEAVRRAG
jgi:cytochrome oxidase Cu insertion factor (SCO1/SenC/PrrC family)